MAIEKVDGFFVGHFPEHIASLGIESARLISCLEEVNKSRIRGVFGSPSYGFCESNLDFLERINHVESVWFWDISLNCIEGIYSLSNLRYFGVHPKRKPIDFSKLQSLEEMVWEFKKQDKGVGLLSRLRKLSLHSFNPKSKTFAELELPPNLEQLKIIRANPLNLMNLPTLNKLKELELSYLSNLTSLNEIERIAPNLERLIVDNCKRLKSYETIYQLRKINYVFILGQRIIKDGKKIQ